MLEKIIKEDAPKEDKAEKSPITNNSTQDKKKDGNNGDGNTNGDGKNNSDESRKTNSKDEGQPGNATTNHAPKQDPIKNNMHQKLEETFKHIEEKGKWSFFYVFELETASGFETSSMAATILTALMSGSGQMETKEKDNVFEMCLESDEFNVADKKELLPVDCSKIKSEIIRKALTLGRHTFLKYFLEHGFNIKSYVKELQKKFQFGEARGDDYGAVLLQNQWETARRTTPKAIGHFYQKETPNGYDRINDAFIWSVMEGNYEISKVIWEVLKHRLAAALLAYGLIRTKVADTLPGTKEREKLIKYQNEFGKLAERTIESRYDKNPEDAFRALRGEVQDWGNTSCIRLATETHNKEFLALEPCRILQERVWWWGAIVNPARMEQNKGTSWKDKLSYNLSLFFAPRIQFYFHFMGYILFLLAYALLIVSRLKQDQFHFLEWIVWVFILSFVIQEFYHVGMLLKDQCPRPLDDEQGCTGISYKFIWAAMKSYWRDHFNKNQLLSLLLFFAGMIPRLRAYSMPDPDGVFQMDIARILFSADFIFFMLGLLRYCYVSWRLGPMVYMIIRMVATLSKFLVILSVFYLAYAIGSEAILYPESKMSWKLVFHVLRKAYWNMFGELFLDELEADGSDHCTECTNDPDVYNTYDVLRCSSQTGRYAVPVMMGIYILIVNILMLNLLIAQFSKTVADSSDRAIILWSYQRFTMLRMFSRSILPFPFILISVLLLWAGRRYTDPFYFNPPPPKDSTNYEIETDRQEILKQVEDSPLPEETKINDKQDEPLSLSKFEMIMKNYHCCCCAKDERHKTKFKTDSKDNGYSSVDIDRRLSKMEESLQRMENHKRDELTMRFNQAYRPRPTNRRSWDSTPLKRSKSDSARFDGAMTHFHLVRN